MDRRQAVQRVALLVGGAILGADLFMTTGCKSATNDAKAGAAFFTKNEIAFLDEVAETILPKTDTPGAKEAQVGAFMEVYVKDCYAKEDQKIFKDGIPAIDKASNDSYKKDFLKLDAAQKHELLTRIDKEQNEYQKTKKEGAPGHYFTMMKQLTLLGFFTSEPGATKALNYVAIPGKYEACIPYKKGDKAFI